MLLGGGSRGPGSLGAEVPAAGRAWHRWVGVSMDCGLPKPTWPDGSHAALRPSVECGQECAWTSLPAGLSAGRKAGARASPSRALLSATEVLAESPCPDQGEMRRRGLPDNERFQGSPLSVPNLEAPGS